MSEFTLEQSPAPLPHRCVLVCQHQTCQRHGSIATLAAFQDLAIPGVTVEASTCMGQCSSGPTVRITPDEIWYYRVGAEAVPEIVQQHLQEGKPVAARLNPRIHPRYY